MPRKPANISICDVTTLHNAVQRKDEQERHSGGFFGLIRRNPAYVRLTQSHVELIKQKHNQVIIHQNIEERNPRILAIIRSVHLLYYVHVFTL